MDFVRVYQCTDSFCNATVLLDQLSGNQSDIGQNYTSRTGYMLVLFTTNSTSGGVQYDGFAASWTSVASALVRMWFLCLYTSHHLMMRVSSILIPLWAAAGNLFLNYPRANISELHVSDLDFVCCLFGF